MFVKKAVENNAKKVFEMEMEILKKVSINARKVTTRKEMQGISDCIEPAGGNSG
jgi:hypothetical protein